MNRPGFNLLTSIWLLLPAMLLAEGRPHIVDELLNKKVDIVINTTEGRQSIEDSASIRKTALQNKIFCTTTIFGAFAFVEALKIPREDWSFSAIQEIN